MKKNIFLSYSLSDRDTVEQFKAQLLKQEEEWEFLEHPILESTEQEWKQLVLDKIKSSHMVVCLFGFSTWESEAVKWEVETAIANEKKVLLVKLKPTVFMIPNYIAENNIKIIEDDIQEVTKQIEFN